MSPLGRAAYRLYAVLVMAPVIAISTFVFGTATILLTFVLPPRVVSRLCGRTWARLNAFFTPMKVRVVGAENLDPTRSYVIVSITAANSQTLHGTPLHLTSLAYSQSPELPITATSAYS